MSRLPASAATAAPASAEARERSRLELALAAARAERRNRPTYLLVGAAVLVIGSVVGLALAVGAQARAETALANQRGAAREFEETAARLRQLRAAGGDRPNPTTETNDFIRSRIIAAAERAGMTADQPGMTAASALVPTVSQDARTPASPDGSRPETRRSKFTYQNVKQTNLETMIQWLNNAVEDIPGLEVYSLTLKPEANGWNMQVAFTRWERVGT